MQVPADFARAGWFAEGPTPGQVGPAESDAAYQDDYEADDPYVDKSSDDGGFDNGPLSLLDVDATAQPGMPVK